MDPGHEVAGVVVVVALAEMVPRKIGQGDANRKRTQLSASKREHSSSSSSSSNWQFELCLEIRQSNYIKLNYGIVIFSPIALSPKRRHLCPL